jgi:DNA-binding transcriptional LysR family regulator
MLDDLNELKTFRAILAEGSLSAAARHWALLWRWSANG